MEDTPSTAREYWIAIRPAPDVDLNVFGPYTLQEAQENRHNWVESYPESAVISMPYHAETRDSANLHASFYMPIREA